MRSIFSLKKSICEIVARSATGLANEEKKEILLLLMIT